MSPISPVFRKEQRLNINVTALAFNLKYKKEEGKNEGDASDENYYWHIKIGM